MGITPWPYDLTEDGTRTAYQFVDRHCDLVSHQFDAGIPWQEAFDGSPFPASLQKDIDVRLAHTPDHVKVLLSVAPLQLSRRDRAGNWKGRDESGKGENWSEKSFTDSAVIAAYINFIERMSVALRADFINFGVESNSGDWDALEFEEYIVFLKQVYLGLQQRLPGKPLFISCMVLPESSYKLNARKLAAIGDYMGLSAYPYSYVGSNTHGNTNPELIPKGLFEEYIDMGGGKPWCFAETGYIAEYLLLRNFGISKAGKPEWQRAYVEKICKLAERRNAAFLVWFCHRDYDQGSRSMRSAGTYTEDLSFWQDIGLEDEDGNERPALEMWQRWFTKTKL